jgi:hypothetical protein
MASSPADLMRALNANLLASNSATLTLEAWCAERRLSSPARVVALRGTDMARPASPEIRARLGVAEGEMLGYRRVRLTCGSHVLSEADNWFVPTRLSAEMNATLASTDTAFGRVILPLSPRRITLGIDWLWNGQGAPPAVSQGLFRHRALVEDGQGRPLAYVQETYLAANLAVEP